MEISALKLVSGMAPQLHLSQLEVSAMRYEMLKGLKECREEERACQNSLTVSVSSVQCKVSLCEEIPRQGTVAPSVAIVPAGGI